MRQNIRKEPFRAPEGYLDSFTADIMKRIPAEAQPITMSQRRGRAVWYSAACITLLLGLSAMAYLYMPDGKDMNIATQHTENQQTYNVDDVADYAMLDHQDIYEIISE